MEIAVPPMPCYLAEWYRPEVTDAAVDATVTRLDETAASMCSEGMSVQLLMTLAVPTDEVMFCVFAADSAQSVAQVCQRAGLPAERLTAAADARILQIETE
ncbi:MAG TPA: nickel-binding protein [Mycobacterium sp.]|jgi:hypothetical protein